MDGKPLGIPDGDKIVHDIVFTPGMPNTRKFKVPPVGIVLHWTGGEGAAGRVAATLIKKRLGIHFTIDRQRITQMADLTTQCAHVGRPGNTRFLGIEVTSRGFANKEDLQGSSLRDRQELDWSEPRDVYTEEIGGKRARMVSFTPEQVDNTIWLVETLCGVLDIPRVIPWTSVELPAGQMPDYPLPLPIFDNKWAYPVFDRDPRKWRKGRAHTFEGVLGHFHVHKTKFDPGTQLFHKLWDEGFNPLGHKFFGKPVTVIG